jgi:hypothetical protein
MAGATTTIAWITASQARLIALGAAIPILTATLTSTSAEYQSIRADADAVLRAADRAQETLRDRLPEVAAAQANRMAVSYGPPVQRGFAAPRALPVRRGQPLELCARALPFDRPMARDAFDPVVPPPAREHARSEAERALMPACLTLGAAAMELEPGARLGGERFQLRYFVLGRSQSSRGQQGVEVATWGKGPDQADDGTLGFAQAEYYFDGEGTEAQREADALMTLGWRARFRRFRSPDLAAEVAAACQQTGGGPCVQTARQIGALTSRVAH